MKKLLLYLILATALFGADAANDLILTQRKADNSGNIQRNVAPTASGFLTFDSSKIPGSTIDITYVSPVLNLNVTGTTNYRGFSVSQFSASTDSAKISGRKARGTAAAPTVITTGDFLTRWSGWGYDGANFLESGSIVMGSEGTIAATRVPSFLAFHTSTNALPSVLTEAARFDSSQRLRFGGVAGGYVSGSSGAINLTADGTNQNVTITPSGTGGVGINTGSIGVTSKLVLAGSSVATAPSASTWAPTGNPMAQFYSEGNTAGDNSFLFAHAGTSAGGTSLNFLSSGGTLASPSAAAAGAVNQILSGYHDGGAFRNTALIGFATGGTVSSGNAPQDIFFSTGETTGRTERVRILSNGLLSVARTSTTTAAWTTGGIAFRTAGSITFTDSTSSGAVPLSYASKISIPTFNSTNSVTIGRAATLLIEGDVVGTGNTSITNSYGLENGGKSLFIGTVRLGSVTGALLNDNSGAFTLTGGAGNMTITAGTGNSRTLTLQTTTSGGTATNAVVFSATQSASFNGPIIKKVSALTYASPTSVDVTLGNLYTVTTVNATGSVTFNATAGGTSGQEITFIITNDATSAKTITFGTNFTPNGTLTASGVSKITTITFMSDGTAFREMCRTVLP